MKSPAHTLDYAVPDRVWSRTLQASVGLFVGGAIVCLLNLAAVVASGAEFLLTPGLSLTAVFFFFPGALEAAILSHRRQRWGVRLLLMHLIGIALSVGLALHAAPSF